MRAPEGSCSGGSDAVVPSPTRATVGGLASPQSLHLVPMWARFEFVAEHPAELSVRRWRSVMCFTGVAAPDGWCFTCDGSSAGLVPASFLAPASGGAEPAWAAAVRVQAFAQGKRVRRMCGRAACAQSDATRPPDLAQASGSKAPTRRRIRAVASCVETPTKMPTAVPRTHTAASCAETPTKTPMAVLTSEEQDVDAPKQSLESSSGFRQSLARVSSKSLVVPQELEMQAGSVQRQVQMQCAGSSGLPSPSTPPLRVPSLMLVNDIS